MDAKRAFYENSMQHYRAEVDRTRRELEAAEEARGRAERLYLVAHEAYHRALGMRDALDELIARDV